jgi:lipid-binding SYLF domain-containing protein
MKLARVVWSVILFAALIAVLWADEDRLRAAETVLSEIADAHDRGIPADLMAQAKCVVVVPGVKRAAIVVGGQFGRGYMSCRRADGHAWSAPGGVRVEGGSVGFQIGGSETDVLLVVRNQSGVDRLLSSQFTVGADAGVAAGPVGRQASAQTDATMRAEILAYSHARGVFAGVALQGATLREDSDENRALYGSSLSNREIVTGAVTVPPAAQGFVTALGKY